MSVYAVKLESEPDPFCSPSPFSPDRFSLLTDPAGLLQEWCVVGSLDLTASI